MNTRRTFLRSISALVAAWFVGPSVVSAETVTDDRAYVYIFAVGEYFPELEAITIPSGWERNAWTGRPVAMNTGRFSIDSPFGTTAELKSIVSASIT